jgi:hypothetical protein
MLDKIGRSKWFWLGLILFIICAILFELVVVNVWAVRRIATGQWDVRLLIIGLFIILLDLIIFLKKNWNSKTKKYRKPLFLLLLIWSMIIYGFWKGLLFIGLITIASRFLRVIFFVLKRIHKRKIAFK